MTTLILGIVIFIGVHSLSIFALPWRNGMVQKLGQLSWKAGYGIASLVGLVLIAMGYSAARMDPILIYTPPTWLRHVTLLLMIPVFPIMLSAYLPGRIKTTLKHPMLVAVKLWALSHLIANGMLADVVLFGSFLIWAVVDRISVKRRPANPVPTLTMPSGRFNDLIAISAGLGLYVFLLLWGHLHLIGVAPIGRP